MTLLRVRRFLQDNLFWISISLGVAMLLVLAITFYLQLPSRTFTILTGREGGAYHSAALEYQKIAAEKGFTLNVVPTAGSAEVLQRLLAGEAEAGFVQGGTAAGLKTDLLTTAASVFYEPLWIFYRRAAFPDEPPTRFEDFAGKRVNLGEVGSGTHVLATVLIEETGVLTDTFEAVALSSTAAVEEFAAGTLDAGFFVLSTRAAAIQSILAAPGIELMSLDLAPAYAARHRYLSELHLPAGALNPAIPRPAEDTSTLSTVANVVTRADMHPDLLRLLTIAMVRTHEAGGLLEEPREFPNLNHAELPINSVQLAYLEKFKNGESTLDNYLPFWAASIVDRYLILLLPFALIVFPILGRAPEFYGAFINFRINARYRMIRDIDERIPRMNVVEIDRELDRIDDLDTRLMRELQVANQFMPQVFDLRSHLDLLDIKLRKRRDKLTGAAHAEQAVQAGQSNPAA